MQAVRRHDANQTTALLGAHNGGKRLCEPRAPAARQKGHPARGPVLRGRIETQLMVALPIGERDRGSSRAGQLVLKRKDCPAQPDYEQCRA